MAYTYREAIRTAYTYLQIEEKDVTIIPDTNNRGLVYDFEGNKMVVFIYPISCKQNNRQNFFDTRDSGAKERGVAWDYAKEKGYRYFCLGFNEEQERYRDYVLSLESDETSISNVSFRKAENSEATGTQVNIPNDFIPTEHFERIKTPKGFYISAIRKEYIADYLRMFDNRPYALDMMGHDVEDCDGMDEDLDEERVTGGANVLYYGVPGSGKSYTINQEINGRKHERVVFHPDYTYSDFVGQIMPKLKKTEEGEEKLSYEFIPGPFTKALDAAINNPGEMFYLVIEEINRGNAPAIFGDVFQLLDRNEDGAGKYHITNFDIAREVFDDETEVVKLPSNLSIYATMNTSDQNIFTLDTAFQRRWHMKYVKNEITEAEHHKNPIAPSEVTWGQFATAINKEIVTYNSIASSSEDKQLGAFFVKGNELGADVFPEKVLKYLWDDAFKLDREQIFGTDIKSIGDLIGKYHLAVDRHEDPLKTVMRAEVYSRMMEKIVATSEEHESETDAAEMK